MRCSLPYRSIHVAPNPRVIIGIRPWTNETLLSSSLSYVIQRCPAGIPNSVSTLLYYRNITPAFQRFADSFSLWSPCSVLCACQHIKPYQTHIDMFWEWDTPRLPQKIFPLREKFVAQNSRWKHSHFKRRIFLPKLHFQPKYLVARPTHRNILAKIVFLLWFLYTSHYGSAVSDLACAYTFPGNDFKEKSKEIHTRPPQFSCENPGALLFFSSISFSLIYLSSPKIDWKKVRFTCRLTKKKKKSKLYIPVKVDFCLFSHAYSLPLYSFLHFFTLLSWTFPSISPFSLHFHQFYSHLHNFLHFMQSPASSLIKRKNPGISSLNTSLLPLGCLSLHANISFISIIIST